MLKIKMALEVPLVKKVFVANSHFKIKNYVSIHINVKIFRYQVTALTRYEINRH